jgi:multiple sugar transport system permease protein
MIHDVRARAHRLPVRLVLQRHGGLVNNALLTLGLVSTPIAWLVDEPNGMISLMLATIWMTMPVVTIVLLAGRLSLSEEHYDAASVDGASVYQRMRHITLPQMRPFFIIVMVLLSLDLARAYDIVRIMTDGRPGPPHRLIWTYAGQLAIRGRSSAWPRPCPWPAWCWAWPSRSISSAR